MYFFTACSELYILLGTAWLALVLPLAIPIFQRRKPRTKEMRFQSVAKLALESNSSYGNESFLFGQRIKINRKKELMAMKQ
jgi:hypothetical protein